MSYHKTYNQYPRLSVLTRKWHSTTAFHHMGFSLKKYNVKTIKDRGLIFCFFPYSCVIKLEKQQVLETYLFWYGCFDPSWGLYKCVKFYWYQGQILGFTGWNTCIFNVIPRYGPKNNIFIALIIFRLIFKGEGLRGNLSFVLKPIYAIYGHFSFFVLTKSQWVFICLKRG